MSRLPERLSLQLTPGTKIVIAAIVLAAIGITLLLHRARPNILNSTGGGVVSDKPTSLPPGRLPPSDGVASRPRYPLDIEGYSVKPPVQNAAEPANPPLETAPAIPGQQITRPAPAGITQVHSLSEAAAVMGADPSGGQVGVPQVHPLPEAAKPVVQKIDVPTFTGKVGSAINEIGAPPGVPADAVGQTKTLPLPKDTKKPPNQE